MIIFAGAYKPVYRIAEAAGDVESISRRFHYDD